MAIHSSVSGPFARASVNTPMTTGGENAQSTSAQSIDTSARCSNESPSPKGSSVLIPNSAAAISTKPLTSPAKESRPI
ncbi:MAG: hypothetical protein IPN01_03470 [Deltaproteobacteria bacterium]|nr:hypothetical protein [Deltaproteobacteria bacterium]